MLGLDDASNRIWKKAFAPLRSKRCGFKFLNIFRSVERNRFYRLIDWISFVHQQHEHLAENYEKFMLAVLILFRKGDMMQTQCDEEFKKATHFLKEVFSEFGKRQFNYDNAEQDLLIVSLVLAKKSQVKRSDIVNALALLPNRIEREHLMTFAMELLADRVTLNFTLKSVLELEMVDCRSRGF